MTRNYWVTSDTHFFHERILEFEPSRRKLGYTAKEMNEGLIERWNRVVKPGDYIYHLGDVFLGVSEHEERAKLLARLNGSKRLIVGNHDDIPYLSKGGFFKKVSMWKLFKEFKVLMTHVPIHESSFRGAVVNLHGHTHSKGSPKGPYISACVELTDFTPVNLEKIRDSI